MSKWTPEAIRDKLMTSDVLVERAVLVLFNRQTLDEQLAGDAKYDNKMGFNGSDAKFMTRQAIWIKSGIAKGIPEGKRLGQTQREIVRKRLLKYVKQLHKATQ